MIIPETFRLYSILEITKLPDPSSQWVRYLMLSVGDVIEIIVPHNYITDKGVNFIQINNKTKNQFFNKISFDKFWNAYQRDHFFEFKKYE